MKAAKLCYFRTDAFDPEGKLFPFCEIVTILVPFGSHLRRVEGCHCHQVQSFILQEKTIFCWHDYLNWLICIISCRLTSLNCLTSSWVSITNRMYPIRSHRRINMLFLFLVGLGLAVLSCLSFALSSPHSTISVVFVYFPHTAWTQECIAFYSGSFFPAKTEIGVFPPSWWYPCMMCWAELRRWQPRCVFLWQGAVGCSGWLKLSSSWGRPRAPWPPVLGSAHRHTLPPQDQGRRRPDDGGAGFSLRLKETWCPLPVGFICLPQDHKSCAAKHSKLHRLGWKVPDHKHTYTQNNPPTATFTQHPSIYS